MGRAISVRINWRIVEVGHLRSLHSLLQPDDNGTSVAYVPAIAACHAWGETPETAQQALVHVFDMIRDRYIEAEKSLPADVELVASHAI